MSSTWINGIRYEIGSSAYHEALLREERRQKSTQAWKQAHDSLLSDVKSVHNAPEREELSRAIESLKSSFIKSMTDGNNSEAEKVISNMRQKIISVQTEEKILASKRDELRGMLYRLDRESTSGFAREIDEIRRGDTDSERATISEQMQRVSRLIGMAGRLALEVAAANNISLDGITEDIVFIPPVNDENESESVSLIQDICDFGGRIAFFDEYEADRLKPLVIEAKQGASLSRLNLIRTQIKTTYIMLKEASVLTAMFKQDIREFLSIISRAKGTQNLCLRMEELLTAPTVTREEYNEVLKEAKSVFTAQMSEIESALLAEKIGETLQGMGYTLFDEEGNPADMAAGKMYLVDTPYEGYRARVKVGENHTVVTRLVRVVGSEEEKLSVSEYQRQKDIETGEKWCKNLEQLYKALENEGISSSTVLRKDPSEEALDVVVDEAVGKSRKCEKSSERQTENLQSMKIGG